MTTAASTQQIVYSVLDIWNSVDITRVDEESLRIGISAVGKHRLHKGTLSITGPLPFIH
jgi:hypothetical protein